jgi:hypothetical protein
MITKLSQYTVDLLKQIERLLEQLSDQTFIQVIPELSGATIGQHARHVLEFYLELETGYYTGKVNYDARKRDRRIESERMFAISVLRSVSGQLEKEDKELRIITDYSRSGGDLLTICTNYNRELIYNLEHTVHHMALMRVGVQLISPVILPDDFGIAVSTLKYKVACAQ